MSRITRNTQTPPPVRSTPPAKSHAKPPAKSHANGTTTPATNTPANQTTATNRVHELTQDARFVRAGLERTLTTQAVIEAYQAVIDAYRLSSDTGALSPIAAARELARRLQNGDENFRKQLMREFLLHPDLSDVDRAQILQAAGGDTLPVSSRPPITEDERQIIVQSLDQLYQGAVNDRALQNALSRIVEMEFAMAQWPGNPFHDRIAIARLIAESGSPRLKELYANEVLSRLFRTSGTLVAPEYMANSLVCVLNSDPDLFEKVTLQQLAPVVEENGRRVVKSDKMVSFVSMLIRTNERKMNGQSVDYLSLFFSALSGASREVQERAFIAIVEGLDGTIAGTIGSQPQVMEALANIYINPPEWLTTYFMGAKLENIRNDGLPIKDESAYDYSTRLGQFSRFWQYTLYSPLVSNETKSRLAEAIGKVVRAYHTMPSGLLIGRLAGTILGGFIQRVQQQQEEYEARRAMISVFFKTLLEMGKDKIPPVAHELAEKWANEAAEIVAGQLVEKRGFFGLGPWQHRDPSHIKANKVLEKLRYVFDYERLPDTDGVPNNFANGEQTKFDQGVKDIYLWHELSQYAWK